MFERNSDAPRHQIAAAAHPIRPLVADPDDVVEAPRSVRGDVRHGARRIVGSVLETIKFRGVSSAGACGIKPAWAQRNWLAPYDKRASSRTA